MAFIPQRMAIAGAAGVGRRGIPGLPGSNADEPEVDVLGALLPTPPAGGFSLEEYAPELAPKPAPAAPDPMAAKRAAREGEVQHAAATATKARTDAASGTAQGATALYRGTGQVRSNTASTGGVSTGAPGAGAGIRIDVPGRGWEDYDPNDPTVREAFAQARGGEDTFMKHRERSSPSSRVSPAAAQAAVPRQQPAPTESYSDVLEGSQLENWDQYLKGREAEQQTFETGLAQSRAGEATAGAQTARAEELTKEPFMAETIAASGKLSEAQVKAATDIANRDDLKKTMNVTVAEVERLRRDPKFIALPPNEQKRLEDQLWDQARLALSAFTKTNLYPRPDPYSFLSGGSPANPGEDKPAT